MSVFCRLTFSDINECSSEPCMNGATCDDRINNYVCTCTPGWTGTDCESGTLSAICNSEYP